MGRGRRPYLALEPTRALQTQRAFRQRKAEHLASLEDSVKQLTDENAKLRKLLSLEPTARALHSLNTTLPSSSSSSVSHASLPIAPAKTSGTSSSNVSTPASLHDSANAPAHGAACDNCASLQDANRQLAVLSAQAEDEIHHLHQSLRALRSVFDYHNIPLPPTVPSDVGISSSSSSPHAPSAKRLRADVDGTPSGIAMTSSYFNAASPAEQIARRPTLPATAATSVMATWHTPSPSAIISAPTPPSASFSPRHALSHASPANTAAVEEAAYYKPRHTRQASVSAGPRQLPPPAIMSPARPPQHLQHAASSRRQSSVDHDGSRPSYSSESARGHRWPKDYPQQADHRYSLPTDYPQLPGRSQYSNANSPAIHPTAAASVASPSYSPHGAFEATAPLHSPRIRTSHSPRERAEDPTASIYARPSSHYRPAETKEPRCCPPSKQEEPPEDAAAAPTKRWASPPPLGVTFDMRADGADVSQQNGKEPEEECCFGLVKCDASGRIII